MGQKVSGSTVDPEDVMKNEILSIRSLFSDTDSWDEESHNYRYNHRNHHYQLLVRLDIEEMERLKIVQRFETWDGEMESITKTVTLSRSRDVSAGDMLSAQKSSSSEPLMQSVAPSGGTDYYDNLSIRKAVVLSRYIRILRDWVENDAGKSSGGGTLKPTKSRGGTIVSTEFQSRFEEFTAYFQKELKLINDDELTRDLNVLRHLLDRKR